jgi:hypothetical protein
VQTLDLARSPSIAGAPVHLGFRRIVTLHCCSSALHQIHGKRLGASVPEPTVQPDPGVLCRARAGADERRVWPGRRCHFWQKMAAMAARLLCRSLRDGHVKSIGLENSCMPSETQ